MVQQLYLNKQSDFPVITFILIGTSFLVTIGIYIIPDFASFLRAEGENLYFWQRFTTVFAHNSPNIPFGAHLGGNILGLLYFGSLLERLLGTKRYFFVVLSFLSVFVFSFNLNQGIGDGLSCVTWGFFPFGGYIFSLLWKKIGVKVFKDPWYILGLIILIFGSLVYPIFIEGNRYHEIALVLGFVSLFLQLHYIKNRLEYLISDSNHRDTQKSKFNFIYYLLFLLIPIFILSLIVIFSISGFRNSSGSSRFSDLPTAIERVESEKGEIIDNHLENNTTINIYFYEEMSENLKKSVSSISPDGVSPLSLAYLWISPTHFEISLNRALVKNETLSLVLFFFDKENNPLEKSVELIVSY